MTYSKTKPYNFNPAWINYSSIKDMKARIGSFTHVEYTTAEQREASRHDAALGWEPLCKCPTRVAKGSLSKIKGGVLPRALLG